MLPEVLPTTAQEIAPDTFLIPTLALEITSGAYIGANSMVIRGSEPVIVDTVCALVRPQWLEQAFSVLRKGGRIVSIRTPPEPRECFETAYEFVRPSGYDLGEHITPLFEEDALRPHIQQTFPLAAAAEAMEILEGGHVRGKLVLTLD